MSARFYGGNVTGDGTAKTIGTWMATIPGFPTFVDTTFSLITFEAAAGNVDSIYIGYKNDIASVAGNRAAYAVPRGSISLDLTTTMAHTKFIWLLISQDDVAYITVVEV